MNFLTVSQCQLGLPVFFNSKYGTLQQVFIASQANKPWKYKGVNLTPFCFFSFLSETPWNFSEKNKKILEILICDLLIVESMFGSTLPEVMEKDKSPIQDFLRFRYKNQFEFDFFK